MDDISKTMGDIRNTQTAQQEQQHKTAIVVERIAAKLEGVTNLGNRVDDIEDSLTEHEVRLKLLELPGAEITGDHEKRIAKLEKMVIRIGGGVAVLIALGTIGREIVRLFYH